MTAIDCCMCNLAEKEPAKRGKVSMAGVTIGKEFYCKKCNKPLGLKDIDTFAYELSDDKND